MVHTFSQARHRQVGRRRRQTLRKQMLARLMHPRLNACPVQGLQSTAAPAVWPLHIRCRSSSTAEAPAYLRSHAALLHEDIVQHATAPGPGSAASAAQAEESRRARRRRQPRLPQQLSPLHQRIMQDIRSKHLLQPQDTLLLAVSGGQASNRAAGCAGCAGRLGRRRQGNHTLSNWQRATEPALWQQEIHRTANPGTGSLLCA